MASAVEQSDGQRVAVRARGRLAVIAAVGAIGLLPEAADAAGPGRWGALSGPLRGNDQHAALLRTADGRLHVAWREQGATTAALVHRPIARNGALGPPSAVVSGFAGVANPSLLGEGAALRVFFGGARTVASDEPVQGILTATSGDGGATWSAPQTITPCCSPQGTGGGPVSAVRLADGTPLVFSSGSAFGIVAHRGLDPATPLVSYSGALQGFGTLIGATAERDLGTGSTVVAFQATAGPRDGVWAQTVDPVTGGPQSQPLALPGLGGGFVTSSQLRTPVAARAGGGLFLAFSDTGSGLRTLLWRHGASRAVTLSRGGGTHRLGTVAATPDRRLWVVWTQDRPRGGLVVVARRSNPTVTRFGERVTVAPPANTQSIFALDASSQARRLDVVANVGTFSNAGAGYSNQHTQLLPPLELAANPRSFRGGRQVRVRFTVTDVGVPVAGAIVKAAGRSDTTDSRGRAELLLQGPRGGGSIRVSARKPDYRTDSLTLAVRRVPRTG